VLFICGSLSAQDDIYNTAPQKSPKSDSALFKSDIEKIQFCLGSYQQQRQTALIVTLLGSSIAAISVLALDNAPQAQTAGTYAGGIIAVTGIIINIDAEKWLRKASISISPTSLKINF